MRIVLQVVPSGPASGLSPLHGSKLVVATLKASISRPMPVAPLRSASVKRGLHLLQLSLGPM